MQVTRSNVTAGGSLLPTSSSTRYGLGSPPPLCRASANALAFL